MENIEIERKWLMDGFPEMACTHESHVEQAYLAFAPNTVRIRKETGEAGSIYTLTIKGGGTLTRTEVEVALDAGQYAALLAIAAAPKATKRYRRYKLPGGETLECSLVDEGEPCAFYYAEVEFPTEEAAHAFCPPPGARLGREVTQEPGYSMAEHCRKKAGQGEGHEG